MNSFKNPQFSLLVVNIGSNSPIKKSPLGSSIFSRGGGALRLEAVRTVGEGRVDSTDFKGL